MAAQCGDVVPTVDDLRFHSFELFVTVSNPRFVPALMNLCPEGVWRYEGKERRAFRTEMKNLWYGTMGAWWNSRTNVLLDKFNEGEDFVDDDDAEVETLVLLQDNREESFISPSMYAACDESQIEQTGLLFAMKRHGLNPYHGAMPTDEEFEDWWAAEVTRPYWLMGAKSTQQMKREMNDVFDKKDHDGLKKMNGIKGVKMNIVEFLRPLPRLKKRRPRSTIVWPRTEDGKVDEDALKTICETANRSDTEGFGFWCRDEAFNQGVNDELDGGEEGDVYFERGMFNMEMENVQQHYCTLSINSLEELITKYFRECEEDEPERNLPEFAAEFPDLEVLPPSDGLRYDYDARQQFFAEYKRDKAIRVALREQ